MSDEKKPLVSIELGASAKVEIKAEIPSSSVGRLVDALTDSIRPFTERRGLKADQIRLQREDTMIAIALKARERLGIEGKSPETVPNRILVPLIEKASLTDSQDETLIDAWSNILASASSNTNRNHSLFVDVLSKLEANHLQFLEFLAMLPSSPKTETDFLMRSERDVGEWVNVELEMVIKSKPTIQEFPEKMNKFGDKLRRYLRVPGSTIVAGGAQIDWFNDTGFYEFPQSYNVSKYPQATTGALESLNLVRRISLTEPSASAVRPWVEFIQFTMFGYEFFYAAHSGRDVWGLD